MCIYINWAAPTIDILFVCGLPSDEYQLVRSDDCYFKFGHPPIINVFRQPSEPFSLDSSHALTPIILGCSSAYGMHVCQFQYSLITCKYINMNILA